MQQRHLSAAESRNDSTIKTFKRSINTAYAQNKSIGKASIKGQKKGLEIKFMAHNIVLLNQ